MYVQQAEITKYDYIVFEKHNFNKARTKYTSICRNNPEYFVHISCLNKRVIYNGINMTLMNQQADLPKTSSMDIYIVLGTKKQRLF